ncbi:MAG: right-handed parallel beta-helix repeat-containing protein [Tepidisphaeraceae bacterium]
MISCLLIACIATSPVTPLPGMSVSRSTTFTPGSYRIDRPIQVAGDHVILDFSGVELVGTDDPTRPDQFSGTAIEISAGSDITIRNLRARGYKIAIHARGTKDLHISGCDFSFNYRQRLKSILQKEDEADWLSYHHNESDEWLRYGAAMYLKNCSGARVDGCTVHNGQNGLMLVGCDNGQVWNNDFSFNSGVGIGLYRSSGNKVLHNRLDWCVRGYSHGVYARGQDSAAILVYEQSCRNEFAYNSATHSGDGFFLWAGQSTMDSGQGGCNDNVIALNDFSHSPCNGIEVTFSSNKIANNTIDDCEYGIWGGYSYKTQIIGNSFAGDGTGIAIEHGQDNVISGNNFARCPTGIRLWMNAKQDPNWGYPKHRDTKSRNYSLRGNLFIEVGQPITLRDTIDVGIDDNGFGPATQPVKSSGDTNGIQVGENQRTEFRVDEFWAAWMHPAPIKGAGQVRLPADHPRGREYILVDEWGPYDFRSPKALPRGRTAAGNLRFEILGPPGEWKLLNADGAVSVSPKAGFVPGELSVAPAPGNQPIQLRLEYSGGEVISQFGVRTPAGQPSEFHYP